MSQNIFSCSVSLFAVIAWSQTRIRMQYICFALWKEAALFIEITKSLTCFLSRYRDTYRVSNRERDSDKVNVVFEKYLETSVEYLG